MSELTVGSLLEGRYRIEADIATGGMSTVYRCVDTRLGRMVAAKVMDKRYHNDPVFRKRFEREAQAMAQLSHPCLVNVYDYSAEADQIFLIMELITGGTLRELLAERGPMPPHAAVAVMRPTLTGLKVAHDAGMVHRDIKPDNVLINVDHQIKLADFGLVRAISESQATTDQIVGTVSYLSPEQILGSKVTAATDVYSAGILLFELLTGKTPFSGDTQLAHAVARLERNVPKPSTFIQGIPPQFDEIVLRATAREPAHRYHDAGEFLQAIERAAAALRLPSFVVPVPENSAAHRANRVDATRSFDPNEDDTGSNNSNKTAMGGAATAGALGGAAAAAADTRKFGDDTTALSGGAASSTSPTGSNTSRSQGPQGSHRSQSGSGPQAEPSNPETQVLHASTAETLAQNPLAHATPAPAPLQEDLFPRDRYRSPSDGYGAVPHQQVAAAPDPRAWAPSVEPAIAPSEPVSNRSGAKFGFWVTFLVLITLAVAIGGWWFGSGRYGEVPQVVGLDEIAATTSLEDAGFQVQTTAIYSDDVAQDFVVSTDPAVGSRAVRGDAITMFISRGKPTVPQLGDDRTVDTVRAAIEGRQLVFAQGKEAFSDDVPQGEVIALDPSSGTEVATGSTVTATISKGAEPDTIPHIAGEKEDKARETLEHIGFSVSIVYEFDAATEEGKAIGTNPAAGEKVPHNSEVTLRISTAVKIPDVVGLSTSDAQKKLASAGIQVAGISEASGYTSDNPDDVVAIDPDEGKLIDAANSAVTLYTAGDASVPNTVGKKLSVAVRILQDAGFSVIYDDEADPSDRVYWQSPMTGTAEIGTEVELRTI
ncbi:MAG: PASTA domain-containing protein [Corynebacterium sp.]|nr:PASTA domain-containing protein [Corynebacterium sp.]